MAVEPQNEEVSIEDAMTKIAFLCVMHIERQPILHRIGLLIQQQRDEIAVKQELLEKVRRVAYGSSVWSEIEELIEPVLGPPTHNTEVR